MLPHMPRPLPLGTYTMQRLRVDPLLLLKAARLGVPALAAFSGLTAAWGHGVDVPPCSPIQVTVPQGLGVSARSGLLVSRARLEAGDVVIRRGLRVTSICRTLADFARSMPLAEAVAIADMALHNGLVELDELTAYPIGRELRFGRLLRVRRGHASRQPGAGQPPPERDPACRVRPPPVHGAGRPGPARGGSCGGACQAQTALRRRKARRLSHRGRYAGLSAGSV